MLRTITDLFLSWRRQSLRPGTLSSKPIGDGHKQRLEIEKTIRHLKVGKTPASDRVPPEIIKADLEERQIQTL